MQGESENKRMRYEITTKNYDLEKNNSKNRIVADTDNLVAYGREDLIDKLRFLKRFKIKVIAVHKVRMKDSTYTDVSEKYLTKPALSYYGYNEVSKNHPGYRDRNGKLTHETSKVKIANRTGSIK